MQLPSFLTQRYFAILLFTLSTKTLMSNFTKYKCTSKCKEETKPDSNARTIHATYYTQSKEERERERERERDTHFFRERES